MKRILCFGDSNTWGYDPATQDRFDRDARWTGVLRNTLGPGYEIIEEGLNGRTTVWNDPIEGYKNGHDYLIPCLETHRPLDLVVIMLGTNDLKKRFSLSAFDIASGAGVLVKVVQQSAAGHNPVGGSASGGTASAPPVLLMAPPPVVQLTEYADMFEDAEGRSLKFAAQHGRVAAEMGCAFLDAGSVIVSSPLDGIHFEAGEHAKLGRAVAAKVRELLA